MSQRVGEMQPRSREGKPLPKCNISRKDLKEATTCKTDERTVDAMLVSVSESSQAFTDGNQHQGCSKPNKVARERFSRVREVPGKTHRRVVPERGTEVELPDDEGHAPSHMAEEEGGAATSVDTMQVEEGDERTFAVMALCIYPTSHDGAFTTKSEEIDGAGLSGCLERPFSYYYTGGLRW